MPAILKQAYYFLSHVAPGQRKRKPIVVRQPHVVICVLVTVKLISFVKFAFQQHTFEECEASFWYMDSLLVLAGCLDNAFAAC